MSSHQEANKAEAAAEPEQIIKANFAIQYCINPTNHQVHRLNIHSAAKDPLPEILFMPKPLPGAEGFSCMVTVCCDVVQDVDNNRQVISFAHAHSFALRQDIADYQVTCLAKAIPRILYKAFDAMHLFPTMNVPDPETEDNPLAALIASTITIDSIPEALIKPDDMCFPIGICAEGLSDRHECQLGGKVYIIQDDLVASDDQ